MAVIRQDIPKKVKALLVKAVDSDMCDISPLYGLIKPYEILPDDEGLISKWRERGLIKDIEIEEDEFYKIRANLDEFMTIQNRLRELFDIRVV